MHYSFVFAIPLIVVVTNRVLYAHIIIYILYSIVLPWCKSSGESYTAILMTLAADH